MSRIRLSHDEVLRMIPEAVASIDSTTADGIDSASLLSLEASLDGQPGTFISTPR